MRPPVQMAVDEVIPTVPPSPRCCSGSPQFLLHTVSGVWQSVSKYLKTQRDLNELLTIADVVLK